MGRTFVRLLTMKEPAYVRAEITVFLVLYEISGKGILSIGGTA